MVPLTQINKTFRLILCNKSAQTEMWNMSTVPVNKTIEKLYRVKCQLFPQFNTSQTRTGRGLDLMYTTGHGIDTCYYTQSISCHKKRQSTTKITL